MEAGESLEECLERYPDQAEALRPLLTLAVHIRKLPFPQVRPEAAQVARERMLTQIQAHKTTRVHSLWTLPQNLYERAAQVIHGKESVNMKLVPRLITALLLVCLLGGVLVVNVSANSLPGDALYGVKRAWESAQVTFTSGQTRTQVQARQAAERVKEIAVLQEQHRAALVEFIGRVQSISSTQWVVEGIPLAVDEATVITGDPAVDDWVKVKAQVNADGSLTALTIDKLAVEVPTPPVVSVTPPVFPTEPSEVPSIVWTEVGNPTQWASPPIPTNWSTYVPTQYQTLVPTEFPHITLQPTYFITLVPTQWQTYVPTELPPVPTGWPIGIPTQFQTLVPTWFPTFAPTQFVTLFPTENPTRQPPENTPNPIDYPTYIPTFVEMTRIPPTPAPGTPMPPIPTWPAP